jgi:hypothetical protein
MRFSIHPAFAVGLPATFQLSALWIQKTTLLFHTSFAHFFFTLLS